MPNTVNFKNNSITFFTETNNNFSRFMSGEPTYLVVGVTWEGVLFYVDTALEFEDAKRIFFSAQCEAVSKVGWEQPCFDIYYYKEGEVYYTPAYGPERRATPDEEAKVIDLWVGGYPRTSRQREESHQ